MCWSTDQCGACSIRKQCDEHMHLAFDAAESNDPKIKLSAIEVVLLLVPMCREQKIALIQKVVGIE